MSYSQKQFQHFASWNFTSGLSNLKICGNRGTVGKQSSFEIGHFAWQAHGRQHLRSAATGNLLVPCAQTATGQWSFAVNGSATWNRLPPALWSLDLSESAFKPALKMQLFSTARHHWDIFMILALDINIQTYLLTYGWAEEQKQTDPWKQ